MPETFFQIHWPDDARETCYSPSSIIEKHLSAGGTYSVSDFVVACRTGLRAASERVQEVYGGYGCSRAMAQLAAIEERAGRYKGSDTVRVESLGSGWRRSA